MYLMVCILCSFPPERKRAGTQKPGQRKKGALIPGVQIFLFAKTQRSICIPALIANQAVDILLFSTM